MSRIVESLLPPASNIVWALGNKATAEECLEGLEQAYGVTADGDELYLRFSECFQKDGELASDYLLRLQESLTRVLDGGGIDSKRADNVRVQQFTRGCLYNDTLLLRLDLKKRPTPPGFVGLLREVRQEEQRELDKVDRRNGDKKGTLKKLATTSNAMSASPTDETERISQLEEVVAKLQLQLASSNSSPVAPTRPAEQSAHQYRRNPMNTPQPRRRPIICFNCGQTGHMMSVCTNTRNAELVQQQMAARCKPSTPSTSGNDGGRQ